MEKKLGVAFVFVVLAIFCLNFVSAIKGEIGNSRAVLYPKVGFFGTTIDRTILVRNVNDVPINVSIKANDENSSKMIEVIDDEFILQPGEEKNARFTIKIKKEGDWDLKLAVFFAPPSGKGAGVALSAEYIIHASKNGDDSGSSSGDSTGDNADQNSSETKGNIFLASLKGENGGIGILIVSASTLILASVLIALLVMLKKKSKLRKRSDRSL